MFSPEEMYDLSQEYMDETILPAGQKLKHQKFQWANPCEEKVDRWSLFQRDDVETAWFVAAFVGGNVKILGRVICRTHDDGHSATVNAGIGKKLHFPLVRLPPRQPASTTPPVRRPLLRAPIYQYVWLPIDKAMHPDMKSVKTEKQCGEAAKQLRGK
jgi:hypothetical protein